MSNGSIERKLKEAYEHIEPYLGEQEILKEMCEDCVLYCGSEHDYTECKDKACFKCYLGYAYMCWADNFEGGE